MAKNLSNYWKKPEQRKRLDYVEDRSVIWGYNNDLPLIEKVYVYEGQIIPNRMIKQKNVYEITYIHPQYYINGFTVRTEQDMVTHVSLFGYHPNRDPKTLLYCQPDYKKGVKYDQVYFEMLLTNIRTYYLDNCFFYPGKSHVRYKKMKSMYIQMNEGD
jgi:hypothetical protein